MRRLISWMHRVLKKMWISVMVVVGMVMLTALYSLVPSSETGNMSVILSLMLLFAMTVVCIVWKKGPWSTTSSPIDTFRKRRWMHVIFWEYRLVSIVIIIIGGITIMMKASIPSASIYFTVGPVIIIDILLLFITTFIDIVRKGGPGAVGRFFRSTRWRLTIWYVALLGLILIVFDTTLYALVESNLRASLYATLRARLAQAASMYNAQTQHVTFSYDDNAGLYTGDHSQISTNVHNYGFVLLVDTRGNVLQSSREDFTSGDTIYLAQQTVISLWHWTYDPSWHNLRLQPLSLPTNTTSQTLSIEAYDFGSMNRFRLRGLDYEVVQGVITDPQQHVLALLAVGDASNSVAAQLQLLSGILSVATLLILLLSTAAGYWLADRAMRPVEVITRTVQQIGVTDLHKRLKMKRRDELGELGATFDHMLDRLEAAFERQRQFTADASHELRTPLSIIDLEAERALTRDLTTQEYRKAITIMQQENRHMTRLVNDLLMLARADGEQAKFRHEEVDLSEVVVDTVERLEALTQQTGIAIRMAALPEISLKGDRIYLMQMLTNIVENALKYSAGVGKHVDIDLSRQGKQGQEWALLRVRDDGPGIAQEHLPHLFERFYRVDQSRTHSQELPSDVLESGSDGRRSGGKPTGNGLGLSIAQWIAQVHGGEICVQSIVGLGTVLEVWLPLSPDMK